jgi:hypothetical protein
MVDFAPDTSLPTCPPFPMSRLFVTMILLAAFVCGAFRGSAQENVMDSDPLMARKRLVYSMVGPYGGFSFSNQGGTFTTACNCEFTGGAGTNFVGGIVFERLTRSKITWGATLGYDDRSITAAFQEVEGVVQRSPSTGREYTVPITFRNEAVTGIQMITAMPYVKYHLMDWLFVRGGPSVSYIFNSTVKHTKELLTETVSFPTGEIATVSLPGTDARSVVLEDGPIPQINPLQVGLTAAMGLEFRVGKKFLLAPIAQYTFPFTTISERGDGFTIRSFQVLIEGRWIL